MRARNKLNVRQLASFSKPGVYSDGGGLYLRVRSSGSRSWLFIYAMHGKRREMGLGSDLDVTLARARELARVARSKVLDGIDPQVDRMATKAPPKDVVTFGQFTTDLLDSIEDGFRNPKHRQQWRNTLTTYAGPLFPKPVEDVGTDDILGVLQPIWLSKNETASRVRGRIERLLDAAKAKGLRAGENPAAWRGHLELLLPKRGKAEVRHHAALSYREIGPFMRELASRPATTARALEFTVLTSARSGETRGMTWGEVDLNANVWTIPGERMKAGATHQVPLSLAAMSILQGLMPVEPAGDELVFPAPRGGQLSDMAMSQLLKRMKRGDITVHGFRSSFRDWAGDATAFTREDIEMALAHTIESSTERAYRRGKALEKRRELMAAWAAYCGFTSSGPVQAPLKT